MKRLAWYANNFVLGYMGSALFITCSIERTINSLILFGAICMIWVLLLLDIIKD